MAKTTHVYVGLQINPVEMIAKRSLLWSVMTGFILLAPTTTADARRSEGPIIITPLNKEIILQTGQNYTLECVGNRLIQFKQQEISEEKSGNFYMNQTVIPQKNISQYKAVLELYNVDQFAVGYYACFDNTVNGSEVLTDILEEPVDNDHVSYVYVYVNGSTLFAPMRALVLAIRNKFLVECKPTTPDIKVKLLNSKTSSSVNFIPKIGFIFSAPPKRQSYICELRRGNENSSINIRSLVIRNIPKPTIFGGLKHFMDGETFSINCTVPVQKNIPINLLWTIPGPWNKVTNKSNELNVTNQAFLYRNITITGASKEDAGEYTCESTNSNVRNSTTFTKLYLDKPMLEVDKRSKDTITTVNRVMRLRANIRAYPPANVTAYKDGEILRASEKYEPKSNLESFTLTITNLQPSDSGNYTFRISNGFLTEESVFNLRVKGIPRVDFGHEDKKYLKGMQVSLKCEAVGFPLPTIIWTFSKGNENTTINKKYQDDVVKSVYKVTSILTLTALSSGNITCTALNEMGAVSATRGFLVQEMPGGFGIKDQDKTWFSEGQDVVLKCIASKYDYYNITWYNDDGEELDYELFENEDSLIANLKMNNINVVQARTYTCTGIRIDDLDGDSFDNSTITITVANKQEPQILDPMEETLQVMTFQPVNLTCAANAVPPPEIVWYKDDIRLENNNSTKIETIYTNQTLLNSTVIIGQMKKELMGTYECRVTNQGTTYFEKLKMFKLIQNEPHVATYLSIVGVIIFSLIILVVYLTWKIKKEKQFRKELAAAGLLYFKEGVTKSINPALGIGEQAELLPYDEKFEFPLERLTLGKQLGAGAFGVVYKAEARGIVNAEQTTIVAVKMVKKTADNMYIKALASELKIMVHLGKHINIVNLLGACTKNVGKRELIVIVEYCKYGNIHNYLQRHREVFIDQLNDNPEKNMGKVNRGFSSSSANSGMHSDYFGSTHTQDTDHTFLNTANTSRSGRKDNPKPNNQVEIAKVSETGYVQPEWRSNYESDYSFEGRTPRPLCSRDLLAWSFQIARGMEYLASRKVLHGDLAARNILLAEDNIVKICDFGLARSIYKNDEYQKKENSLLPVKWLAIECMTDRIFSTQSDVWSFGIVLWELFSLAKTPYPNFSPQSLLQWLSEGHRLDKPSYADDRLYELMKRCWSQKPTSRPSFSQLQEIIGSFLEDNVRNHYVDLNAAYMAMNVKQAGEEDYLAMVCSPEYNNIVTPSPHHYANESSFFPPTPSQLQHDDEGYLQMSPATRQSLFNTRAQGTKFDFDARKLTPRVSEANSYGSESTPMLTLNNLPRSGSESDQEGNTSPYLNMCPRIEEETDDVFGTKENNEKNIQPSAVTNPTYITLSVEDEKKLNKLPNNYINVPNGLVK